MAAKNTLIAPDCKHICLIMAEISTFILKGRYFICREKTEQDRLARVPRQEERGVEDSATDFAQGRQDIVSARSAARR